MNRYVGTGNVSESIHFRRYDPRDSDAILALNEWALREVGANPDDIPGNEDLHDVTEAYLDTGGDFLVGVRPDDVGHNDTQDEQPVPGERHDTLQTFDGLLVACGGFLPSEEGHEDERTVPGAAELHRMRVAPTTQGNGYGRALLAELERRAARAGFDPLLATTSLRQEAALSLYRSAGYTEVDRSTFGEYELVHFERPVADERR